MIFFVVCNILFYKSKYYNKKLKSKREKFVDLANKRVTSAIDKIRLIGNLSDRRFYEYSEKDSKQIIDALTKELSSVKSKFQNNAKKKDKEFYGFSIDNDLLNKANDDAIVLHAYPLTEGKKYLMQFLKVKIAEFLNKLKIECMLNRHFCLACFHKKACIFTF